MGLRDKAWSLTKKAGKGIRRFGVRLFSGEWLGETDRSQISKILFWSIVFGLIFAAMEGDRILPASASLLCGMLFGFLFGIPRVSQSNNPEDPNGTNISYQQRVNTNLEEISDWLTKIIVGVGLVQLSKIPPRFESLVEYVAPDPKDRPIVGAIIIMFLILGFFVGYLMTRLYLASAFRNADQQAVTINHQIRDLSLLASNLLPPDREITESGLKTTIDDVEKVLQVSPRSAVNLVWSELMSSARKELTVRQIVPDVADVKVIEQLEDGRLMTANQAEIIERMRQINNSAAYASPEGITKESAKAYLSLAMRSIAQFKAAKQETIPAEV